MKPKPAIDHKIEAARALPSEHAKQVKFFEWANDPMVQKVYPDVYWLYSVPNGGLRNKAVARKIKAEGAKSGVWDIGLDVARGNYTGLRIEMKHGRNKLSENQVKWQAHYLETNKLCAVCYSHVEAVEAVVKYLLLK